MSCCKRLFLSKRLAKLRRAVSQAVLFVLAAAIVASASLSDAATQHSGMLAESTRFATPFYVCDSGKPGPAVLVVGGIHGNEPAGAQAAEIIRHWTVSRGKLMVVPAANALGLRAGTRHIPDEEDSLADLNRDFPKIDEPNLLSGPLAEDIWRFVREQKPDWLVDLHESLDFRLQHVGSTGNSILKVDGLETDQAAAVLTETINATVLDDTKKFGGLRPPKDGSLARAAAVHLHIPSLLLETTRKDQPLELRVSQHQILVHRLLEHLDMLPQKAFLEPSEPAE
jgi:predicted deacylase